MDVQEYLRQRIAQQQPVYKAQRVVWPPPSPPPVPVKEKPADRLSGFLVVCIFIASLAILIGMFFMSDQGKELWVRKAPVQSSPLAAAPKEPAAPSTPDYMRKDEMQQFISGTNQRMDKLEKEVKVWAHRTWVTAVAANENAVLCDKMDIDHHDVQSRGFVRIGENWTLSPMPQNVPTLTEEEKKELREGLK